MLQRGLIGADWFKNSVNGRKLGMETLVTKKVSIVLWPDFKENGSKRKNIDQGRGAVHAVWHTFCIHG